MSQIIREGFSVKGIRDSDGRTDSTPGDPKSHISSRVWGQWAPRERKRKNSQQTEDEYQIAEAKVVCTMTHEYAHKTGLQGEAGYFVEYAIWQRMALEKAGRHYVARHQAQRKRATIADAQLVMSAVYRHGRSAPPPPGKRYDAEQEDDAEDDDKDDAEENTNNNGSGAPKTTALNHRKEKRDLHRDREFEEANVSSARAYLTSIEPIPEWRRETRNSFIAQFDNGPVRFSILVGRSFPAGSPIRLFLTVDNLANGVVSVAKPSMLRQTGAWLCVCKMDKYSQSISKFPAREGDRLRHVATSFTVREGGRHRLSFELTEGYDMSAAGDYEAQLWFDDIAICMPIRILSD
eukprot:TRINITY_DN3888_c0_g2_i1.p1 TRINITY_DN3888_c0_g2~~TRINITY_DN3888_c0_g2_i1.p1  ORF type:complete len:349 (-),score=53.56 TRINITY_DN3888_c0_g2_i1:552-1598(-)